MRRFSSTLNRVKPAILMVVFQAALAGVNIFYKLAASDGMAMSVMIAYRFLFAAAFIVPLALIVERRSRPKLTWIVACQAFLSGLFGGSLAQNLYAECLVLTSATFASAMINLVPAITFILAISFGMERLGLGTAAGKAKVAGTLICVGGAMVLTFYKGLEVNIWSTNVDLLHKNHQHQGQDVATSHRVAGNHDHVLGAFLVVCCCLSSALGLIVQAKMIKNYPCNYSSTAMMTSMGAIQAVVFALCLERSKWSSWKLGWNIRLLSVSYCGIVASGIMYIVLTWCVRMRGPLFVSVFNPLMLVLVAIAGSLVLEEKLHLGSVVGAVVIVCGLYLVLWGKGKEMKRISQLIVPSRTSKVSEGIEVIVTSSPVQNTNNVIVNSNSMEVPSNGIAVSPNNALGGGVLMKNEIQEEE